MNSVEADSVWLWSFIWTWQEAAAAETHQRQALWEEDQIRASDARMDPAKRSPWILTHIHPRTHQGKMLQETGQHTAKASNLSPHFPFTFIGCLHTQLCGDICAHSVCCTQIYNCTMGIAFAILKASRWWTSFSHF